MTDPLPSRPARPPGPGDVMTIHPKRGHVSRPALYLPPERTLPPFEVWATLLGIAVFGLLSWCAPLIARAGWRWFS